MLVVVGACALGFSATALALDAPGGLSASPGSPTQQNDFAFTWSAPAPDLGYVVTGYEVFIDGNAAGSTGDTGFNTSLGEGAHVFSVRAVEALAPDAPIDLPPPPEGQTASITVRVDQTAPRIRAALNPATPNGNNGWYRSLRVTFTCTDTNGSGIASCPGGITVAEQGANQTRSGTAVDRVGLTASDTSPAFNFDGIGPRGGEPKIPSAGARISTSPLFTWSSGGDATSGANHYEVLVRWAGRAEFVAASVPHVIGRSEFSARRASGLPFPERVPVTWRVLTVDNAGNSTSSGSRTFTVDSTVPGAPVITGGPAGFTNRNAPTFTWTGTLSSFAWTVSQAGATTPVQSGQGGTTATLAPLPDGDYTFQVTQRSAAGVPSDEATRSFQVDTLPPPAPTITARPSFPTALTAPSFAWTSEEGASFRWQVLNSNGSKVQGPNDTPLASATVGAVVPGAYNFRVWQIDPAGNVSAPTSDPFAVVGAGGAQPRPTTRSTLPRLNAGKLFPRAGTIVTTRRPLLRWVKGGKGTTLYNLQLFRVVRRTPGKVATVKKVFTAFPHSRSIRLPARVILPSTCYVWRIWPYLGSKFTPKPLGISNFCVAKASVLRKKAAKARRTRAAVH